MQTVYQKLVFLHTMHCVQQHGHHSNSGSRLPLSCFNLSSLNCHYIVNHTTRLTLKHVIMHYAIFNAHLLLGKDIKELKSLHTLFCMQSLYRMMLTVTLLHNLMFKLKQSTPMLAVHNLMFKLKQSTPMLVMGWGCREGGVENLLHFMISAESTYIIYNPQCKIKNHTFWCITFCLLCIFSGEQWS